MDKKRANIAGCLYITMHTDVLINTILKTKAEFTGPFSNIFSSQDHATTVIAAQEVPMYTQKGKSKEYIWCIKQISVFLDGRPQNIMLDDSDNSTNPVQKKYPHHLEGVKGLYNETRKNMHTFIKRPRKDS